MLISYDKNWNHKQNIVYILWLQQPVHACGDLSDNELDRRALYFEHEGKTGQALRYACNGKLHASKSTPSKFKKGENYSL